MTPPADLYCVLGNPVAHSRSPAIHARFAQLTGERMRYRQQLLPLGGFAPGLQALLAQGLRGCNVTLPFKPDAARCASACSARVQLAAAANTLVLRADGSLYADNTDGLGLVADITRNAGQALAGRDLLLLGAGGAAAGVLGPLLQAGPRSITVANRTGARAQALVQAHQALAAQQKTALKTQCLSALQGDWDVIINATSSSLGGAALALPGALLRPAGLACDMMYGPAAQGFLDWARRQGASARDGLGMLVEQAAESFLLWRGLRPPAAQVLAELQAQAH